MKKFIVRIVKFLIKLGILGRVVTFRYQGEMLSLNKFYSAGHWSTRHNAKGKFKNKFAPIIAPAIDKYFFDEYFMVIFYNSNLDVDNVIGMEKVLVDELKGQVVVNDSKRYYKGLVILYDKTLPKNTIEFTLIESHYNDKVSADKRRDTKGN
jgi:hypothetical protein